MLKIAMISFVLRKTMTTLLPTKILLPALYIIGSYK